MLIRMPWGFRSPVNSWLVIWHPLSVLKMVGVPYRMIASCVSFPVKETVSKENFQQSDEYFRRMACIEEVAHKLKALAILDRGDKLSRFEQPFRGSDITPGISPAHHLNAQFSLIQ
jgi:hypothetical protein